MAGADICTAFHPSTSGFRELIDRFLAEREQLLKGPYLSLALPFRQGSNRNRLPKISLPYRPASPCSPASYTRV